MIMKASLKTSILFFGAIALADNTVNIDGSDYTDLGLKGFGYVAADARDKYGDSISFGSSVKYQKGSVSVNENGDYSFIAYNLPDRGWNVNGTVDFASRIYKFGVTLDNVSSSTSPNMHWTYEDSILLKDFNGNYITGLDCNGTVTMNGYTMPAVTYHGDGWGNGLNSSSTTTRVCLDSEALSLIKGDISNGFWISDEYGPGIFRFDSQGNLQEYITAPDAIIPYVNGKINFSSNNPPAWDSYSVDEPESGREVNRGYEGMDLSPDGKTLFSLLQSANTQEGGTKKPNQFNVRLMKYDLSGDKPMATGEYVLQLPTYTVSSTGKVKTAAQSEILYVTDDVLMVLPRDSNFGRGQSDGTESIYRHIDLYSIKDATNILGKYDGEGEKVASKKGKLVDGITPATHYEWININDNTELNKYGVHNGGSDDYTLLNEKWEGLTLIPIDCSTDEYYLLAVSDNDFTTTNGYMNFGKVQFNSGDNFQNQALIWKVKLPTLPHDNTCPAISSASESSMTSSTISSKSGFSNSTTTLRNSTTYGSSTGTLTTYLTTTCSENKCEEKTITATKVCTETVCELKTSETNIVTAQEATKVVTCHEAKCSTTVSSSTTAKPTIIGTVSTYEGGAITNAVNFSACYTLVLAILALIF